MTYLGSKIFGNFRKARTEPVKPHRNSERYKDRPGMSEAHLALVRKLPCAVCLKTPAGEAHHVKQNTGGERGMGIKSTDKWAVGLCRTHHMEIENIGTKNEINWFKKNGISDIHLLVRDLWGSRNDLPKMTKILLAHRDTRWNGNTKG